jgi:uncharacterized protein (TIGR02391 family)
MNVDWAINEVGAFIAVCEKHTQEHNRLGGAGRTDPNLKKLYDDAIARMALIERIADRAWPEWREQEGMARFGWEYDHLVGMSKQLLLLLTRREEIERNLGYAGPSLAAETLNPDVWESAKSLWRNGHFGEAVHAAAKAVNAALQTKVGRRDISDSKLVSECFSLDPPKAGTPRLRLMRNDGSETYKSLHEGALSFGRGCFLGIRNVLAHEFGGKAEPPESLALEYLAAFSLLANWVEQAEVENR